MTGRERVLAILDGRAVDHLPLMPITMMFAADTAGVLYGDYARDYRVLELRCGGLRTSRRPSTNRTRC